MGESKKFYQKEQTPFCFFKKNYLHKGDRTSHWFGHSKIKELDTIDFFERKQMIEDMEAELTDLSDIDSKTDNLAVTEEAYVYEDITMYL